MSTIENWSALGLGAVLAIATGTLPGCGLEGGDDQLPLQRVQSAALVTAPGSCNNHLPQDTSICACMDANFIESPGRPCMIFDAGGNPGRFFMNLHLAPYTALDDQISSIWVGPNAKARVCTNPGDSPSSSCDNLVPNTTISNLAGSGFQDDISSIRVDGAGVDAPRFDCMNPPFASISIFEGANFTGDCAVLDIGNYPNPFTNSTYVYEGGGFGLNDNVISSSIAGPGVHYTLWDQANFLGNHLSLQATVTNYAATTTFNDRTTSIIVDTCAHDLCVQGPPLNKACSRCVETLCAAGNDPFCCDTAWDGICVSEVPSFCSGMSCS